MTDTLPQVTLTTDGAARGNPGPGGWAALLETDGREKLLTGEEPASTTNNAMELLAVVAALETLRRGCRVTLRADSQYVLGGIERLQAGGAPAPKNRALWQRLAVQLARHTLALVWVRGHAGDARNERVDAAANAAAASAYTRAEALTAPAADPAEWTLALLSPGADRPVQWALRGPALAADGSVAVGAETQPTAVWRALIAGLTAAAAVDGAAAARLAVISNYELIVKQGRGEWQVKQAAQRPFAQQLTALRGRFAALRFAHAATDTVRQLVVSTGPDRTKE